MREEATLVGGQKLTNVHPRGQCAGEFCCIHAPSDHHMRDWPQNYRPDRRIMERICEHGVGHVDPDDPTTDTIHGCCLPPCCVPPEEREEWMRIAFDEDPEDLP